MPERKHTPRYPAELRVRGVRLAKENRPDCTSDSAAYASIAEKLECSRFTLRQWGIQEERHAGYGRAGAAPTVPESRIWSARTRNCAPLTRS